MQNLAQEDFPPKLLWNENAEFKFSVNNEGEDVNKKPRSRDRREHRPAQRRQRHQQETEEQEIGIRGIMIVLHCGKPRFLSLPVSPPIYRSTSAKLQFSITARSIECFHMTSRRPYWCPKTMKRRPCWCPKQILWELNFFLMQTLSFVPINLHRCWPRE